MATLLCVHIACCYEFNYMVKNITHSYKEKKYIKCIMSYLPQHVSLGIWVGNFLKADCLYAHLGYRKMPHSIMHVYPIRRYFKSFVFLLYGKVGCYINTQASEVLPVVGLMLKLWSDDRFDVI